jgi:membrane protease subunit HflK
MLVASRERDVEATNSPAGERAVPVNLLSVNIPVQFQIDDVRAWAYQHTDAAVLLEKLAYREVVNYLVSVDIDDLMTTGRHQAKVELQKRIQTRADQSKLGVKILFVGLQGIHPPVDVAKDYEAVIGSLQDKETNILAAEEYQAGTLPMAHADATNRVNQAEAQKVTAIANAAAVSARFTNQLAAYAASPSVFTQRLFLDTVSRAVGPARKVIVSATNTQDILILNLEDKVRDDLLDVPVPPARK